MSANPNIFPALRYRDANAALEWLKRAFGFEEHSVYRDDNGTIVHAELQLAAGMIMFGTGTEDDPFGLKSPKDLGGVTQTIYVCVQDPDARYARAKGAGAEIVRELADLDYGSREFSCRDLEGNLWSFGTYDPYSH
jgi:uncharacterized glyoxalase superfamily protein PhnB